MRTRTSTCSTTRFQDCRERLSKIGRNRLTAQFAGRVSALGQELGVAVTQEFCGRMYDARSDWVHGSAVGLFAGEAPPPDDSERAGRLAEVALLQDVLRRAVRRSIQDAEFRDVFRNDEHIQERWPIASE